MPEMTFFARLWFAFATWFRVLADGKYAAELHAGKALAPPDAAPAAAPLPPSEKPKPAAPSTDAALQLLALFQREGRLVDFLEEDVAAFADAEIGAAARVVHAGCRKALREHAKLEPVRGEAEGAKVRLEDGFDAAKVKLTGNVEGSGPYAGTLRHRGWRVAELRLPTAAPGHDPRIVAQAEVEL